MPQTLGATVGSSVAVGSSTDGTRALQSGCGGLGQEVAFIWTAPQSGLYTFDTFGSTYDTVLSLLSASSCYAPEIGCSDDAQGLQSQVSTYAQAGQTLLVVVDSYGDTGGRYVLNVTGEGQMAPQCPMYELGGVMGQAVVADELPWTSSSVFENWCNGSGAAATMLWTAPYTGTFVFDTAGSTFDTVLLVRDSCDGITIDCNDDYIGLQSRVMLPASAGQSVLIAIQSYGGGATVPGYVYQLNISAQ